MEGVHFCTLNLERSVRKVLEGLAWIKEEPVVGRENPSPVKGGAPLEDMRNMAIHVRTPSLGHLPIL